MSSNTTKPSTTTGQEKFSVAIIGGGIAGLCFAIGLQSRGIPFHIYEAAHKFSEVGAGVGMMPAARRAMKLIDPKVLAGYEKWETTNPEATKDIYFEHRLGKDVGTRKAGEYVCSSGQPGGGMSMIHRAYFLDELVKMVPASAVTFGARVHHVTESDHDATLHFATSDDSHHHKDAAGSTWSIPATARHSMAVACDGIKSSIRSTLFGPKYAAKFSGKYAYRGLIPIEKAIKALGGNELQARTGQLYIAPYGHVLTASVEKGAVMNVVAFITSEDGKWHHGDHWVVPLQREQMMKDYAGWSEEVLALLNLLEKPDTWALFESVPLEKYWQGRIGLIGDAAHATTPHNGSGAGMAIEDAYVLSEAIAQLVHNNANPSGHQIDAALAAFDTVRRPRSQKLVEVSHEAGEVYELHSAAVGQDLDKFTKNVHERYAWIWNEDIAAEGQRVRDEFEMRIKNTA